MGKDWLLKHSTRIRYAESSAPIPLLAGTVARGTDSYTYQDGTPYIGEYVQRMLAIFSPKNSHYYLDDTLYGQRREQLLINGVLEYWDSIIEKIIITKIVLFFSFCREATSYALQKWNYRSFL